MGWCNCYSPSDATSGTGFWLDTGRFKRWVRNYEFAGKVNAREGLSPRGEGRNDICPRALSLTGRARNGC